MIQRWRWPASMLLLIGALAWFTHQPPEDAWEGALTCYLCATFVWGAAMLEQHRSPKLGLPLVLGTALALRAAMLASQPFFSDDIWRYLWDGHVQLSGINPYPHSPLSPALAHLRNEVWPLVNHPEVPTIYPPAAQLVFALAQKLGGGVLPLRLCMVAAELATLPALWRLTRPPGQEDRQRRDARRATVALWLLWNPLMVVEFAGSGHLDTLAIAPLVWAVALVAPRSPEQGQTALAPLRWPLWALAGALVGLSTQAKLLGLLALPPMLVWALWPAGDRSQGRPWPWRGRLARVSATLVGCALALGLTAAPYQSTLIFEESGSFAKGLGTYARKWRANDGAFALIVEAEHQILGTSDKVGPDDRPYWRFTALDDLFLEAGLSQEHEGRLIARTTITRSELELTLAKVLVALILGALLGLVLVLRLSPSASTLAVLMGLLLLAPTVHPWYVAWLVPLAVAHRSRAALLWSALVILAYNSAMRYALEGVWHESALIRVLEYVPVLLLLGYEVWRRALSREDGLPSWHPPSP